MTRKELHHQMQVSGNIERRGKEIAEWKQAFDMYKRETGDTTVSIGCGSCFNKVKKWLERP